MDDLISDHRLALDDLVALGEVKASVADQMQVAFGEAAYHVWRSNAPITCYIALPPAYEPRDDLILRADALLGAGDDLSADVVDQARAAIARDVAALGALTGGDSDPARIIELWGAREIEAGPDTLEAARFLVELLSKD
jgi:hypothetical protein